jgi:hypothetical protein
MFTLVAKEVDSSPPVGPVRGVPCAPVARPPDEPTGAPTPPDEARTRVMGGGRSEADPTPPSRPPRRPDRSSPPGGIWPWVVAIALVLIAGGVLAFVFLSDDGDSSSSTTTEQVSVPALVGFGEAEAVRQARRVGLRTAIRRALGPEAAGTVASQNPVAGLEVARGTLLVLTVSRGPAPVEVPNLIGLNEAQAGVRLSEVGLETQVVRVTSSEPSGEVIRQRPRPGVGVQEGSTVRITVSEGGVPPPTTTTTTTTTGPAPGDRAERDREDLTAGDLPARRGRPHRRADVRRL